MKKITLTKFTQKDSIYVVRLGNGTVHEFKNEKKVKKFLVKTSKFLTKQLYTLNLLFSDTFIQYRQFYFYFDNDRNSRKAKLYEAQREIIDLNHNIESCLNNVCFTCTHTNGNQLTFKYLDYVCRSLSKILITIKNFNKSKSYASTEVRCDHLLSSILQVQSALQEYSIESASDMEFSQCDQIRVDDTVFMKFVS